MNHSKRIQGLLEDIKDQALPGRIAIAMEAMKPIMTDDPAMLPVRVAAKALRFADALIAEAEK